MPKEETCICPTSQAPCYRAISVQQDLYKCHNHDDAQHQHHQAAQHCWADIVVVEAHLHNNIQSHRMLMETQVCTVCQSKASDAEEAEQQ